MKITALTSFCVDHFPERDKTYIGGNSLNFATQCKLSGVEDVSVIGAIGNDKYGELIESHFEKLKINHQGLIQLDKPTASNKIYLYTDGERYFKEDSWNGGAIDVFRLSESNWTQIDLSDIVAMPAGDPNLIELLKRRKKEQVIVIDFLDYLGINFIKKFIDDIDIVFLSATEEILDDLFELSTQKGKMIVATLGANGSVCFSNQEKYFQKSIQVESIVDTTGCGDAFQAAFTIKWTVTKDVEKSLVAGSIAASKVLGFIGGVE